MGCSNSKLDDLPAVQLCRERCNFLDEAIAQRYALAEAHVAYIHSLKEIGFSLDRFFDQDLDAGGDLSPFLNLPPHKKKGDPVNLVVDDTAPVPAAVTAAPATTSSPHHKKSHSRSHSSSGGSHLHFHSDSDDDDDDEDDDDGSLHHSGHSSPSHFQPQIYYNFQDQEPYGGAAAAGGFLNMNNNMNMNYMRNGSTPSVVYQQRPGSPETVHMRSGGGGGGGEGSSSYFNNFDSYPNYENPNPNPYPYSSNSNSNHPNYPPPPTQTSSYSNYGYFGGYGGYGSMYPPTPSHQQAGSSGPSSSMASSSKPPPPPPPPPSPPRTSAWDFLNLFETVDRYYPPNTPSRDSRSVREEEGIPDLEDENFEDEVVKEVHGEQKYNNGGGNYGNFSKKVKKVAEEEEEKANDREGTSGVGGKEGMEYDVHSVDKKVVQNEEKSEEKINVPTFKAKVGSRGVSVVIREIKSQFDRASESGIEVSTMLEAGKVRFHRKGGVHQVSSKMLHSITPSLSVVASHPSTSKSAETSSNPGPVFLEIDERVGMRSGNLSATLQKLYIWEKKLYDEVKAEEKMRIVHERKVRRLKRLDEKGAESQKIDATRTLIRSLSTKIRIAIQVVDKISVKINKLRDEELWPQINELIKGLIRMWKVMLECHQYQCQAIAEAKNLDALTSNRKLSGDHVQATMQLEHELLNWISSFSLWVGAQKGYVKALNGWLVKCLLYEPEETADGIVPFSPSRLGAPPVFVICNQWSQAMDRISEKEVVDAMRIFTMSVHQLSERHSMEFRQRMLTNKDMERKVKELEREEQKMQKEWQTIDKKMAIVSGQGLGLPIPGDIVYQSDTANIGSLHTGLKQIFEAMERFTASSMQAYEELQLRCEEDTHAQENANVP